jgi:hypothetical protein
LVTHRQQSLQTEHVRTHHESLQHVDLGSSDFIVFILLVPYSILTFSAPLICLPVFIKPIVYFGFSVERVAEVGGTGRCDPELLLFSAQQVVNEFLILSLIVLLDNPEVSQVLIYNIDRYKEVGKLTGKECGTGIALEGAVDECLGNQHFYSLIYLL